MGDAKAVLGVKRKSDAGWGQVTKKRKVQEDEHEKLIRGVMTMAGRSDAEFEEEVRRKLKDDIVVRDKRPAVRWCRRPFRTPLRPDDDLAPLQEWRPLKEPPVDTKRCMHAAEAIAPHRAVTLDPQDSAALPSALRTAPLWSEPATLKLFDIVRTVGLRWYVVKDRLCEYLAAATNDNKDGNPTGDIDRTYTTACIRTRYYTVAAEVVHQRKLRAGVEPGRQYVLETNEYAGETDAQLVNAAGDNWAAMQPYAHDAKKVLKKRLSALKGALAPFEDMCLENVAAKSFERSYVDMFSRKIKLSRGLPAAGDAGGVLSAPLAGVVPPPPPLTAPLPNLTTAFYYTTAIQGGRAFVTDAIQTVPLWVSSTSIARQAVGLRFDLMQYATLKATVEAVRKQTKAIVKEAEELKAERDLPDSVMDAMMVPYSPED